LSATIAAYSDSISASDALNRPSDFIRAENSSMPDCLMMLDSKPITDPRRETCYDDRSDDCDTPVLRQNPLRHDGVSSVGYADGLVHRLDDRHGRIEVGANDLAIRAVLQSNVRLKGVAGLLSGEGNNDGKAIDRVAR